MLARATFTIVTWDKEPVDEREGGPDVIGAQGNIPKGPHRGLATFVGKRILARAGAEAKKLPSSSFSSRNSSFPPPNSSFSRSKACPVPRTGRESRGGVWVVQMNREHLHRLASQILITWCAGGNRHGRLV